MIMRARMLAMLIVLAAGGSALAQSVVVFVNGDPITAIDVEQRSKFIVLTDQKPPPRQQVLDQLIDEKLKIREGKRWGIEASDADVDSSYAGMARRMQQIQRAVDPGAGPKGHQRQHAQSEDQGGYRLATTDPRPLSGANANSGQRGPFAP